MGHTRHATNPLHTSSVPLAPARGRMRRQSVDPNDPARIGPARGIAFALAFGTLSWLALFGIFEVGRRLIGL